MKNNFSLNFYIISLMLSLISINAYAENYEYKAEVKGMVCAFCAYNVSKDIAKISGVDADSIDVDLKKGNVIFNSDKKVSLDIITSLFSESGFTISNLTYVESAVKHKNLVKNIDIDMTLDLSKVAELESVIEAVGLYASKNASLLVINAPLKDEKTILGPLLMGRQEVIKIRYIESKTDKIHLQLFSNQ